MAGAAMGGVARPRLRRSSARVASLGDALVGRFAATQPTVEPRPATKPHLRYNAPESTEAAPIVTYVDEETFLTPQLLDEMPEQAHSLPLSPKSGKEAQDDGSLSETPDKEFVFLHNHTGFGGSQAATATTDERSRHSELTGTGGAASSTCPSATAGCSAGVLSVHGRKLLWTLTGRDCQSCNDLFVLDEWPQGEGVESQRFVVAGVILRLVFFPAGSALTGDGDCAVGLLSEDKAKLKFELFLNDRRSGTKVIDRKSVV